MPVKRVAYSCVRTEQRLRDGVRIQLSAGASLNCLYREFDRMMPYEARPGHCWVAEIWLGHGRIFIQQCYDDIVGVNRNRAWIRKCCRAFLDSIAPGWRITR